MKICARGKITEEFWLTQEAAGGVLYGPVIYNGRVYFIDAFSPHFREFDLVTKKIKFLEVY